MRNLHFMLIGIMAISICGGCTTVDVQSAIDALNGLTNKPPAFVADSSTVEPTNKPPQSWRCSCDTSVPIAMEMEDVRQATIGNPQFEECGLESSEGKPVRPMVKSGNHNLTVSSIYLKKLQPTEGGYLVPCNVQWLGYTWTPIGYSINDDHRDKMQVRFETGNPHFIPRTFRVFLFVDGRK